MQCGGCTVEQSLPIIMNPITWLLAFAAITTITEKVIKEKKKK